MPSTLHFISTDLRGSTRSVSAADGKPAAWFDYGPFGDLLETQPSGDANLAARLTRRFTGQTFDAETALYHYGARLYDDQRAGFISADPAHRTPSPYAYCANDPVDHVDPDGRAPHWVVYFNGWFLILDEHNVAVAIIGDEALLDRVTDDVLAQFLSDVLPHPSRRVDVRRQQLIRLAVDGRLWSVTARTRLMQVMNKVLERLLWQCRDGMIFRGRLMAREWGNFRSAFRSQSDLRSWKKIPWKERKKNDDDHSFYHASPVLEKYRRAFERQKAARRLSVRIRDQLNPSKLTVDIEYWYPAFLDNLDNPALQPDPRLYLFLRRGGLPADLDPADRARIAAHVKAVDAQLSLPSNTTTITSPTTHGAEDDSAHESAPLEEESEHVVPAKPGGEKPHMPLDEDTESL